MPTLAAARDGMAPDAGSSAEHLFERVAHGVGPDLVAFGGGVEEVVHDFFGEQAFGGEELFVEVEEADGLAVGEGFDEFVDGFVFHARGIGGLLGAGEDRQQEDLGGGGFFAEGLNDGSNAGGGFGGGVADVVGADHQDDDLGVDVVEFAMGEAVEDVLGAVAADAVVGGFEVGEFLGPDILAAMLGVGALPVVGDGVAFEVDVDISLLGEGEEFFVFGEPGFVGVVEAATGDGLVGGFARSGGFFGGGGDLGVGKSNKLDEVMHKKDEKAKCRFHSYHFVF